MCRLGRRSAMSRSLGEFISEAGLLSRLPLSSESMLDKLLALERSDGLSSAVVGSPLTMNSDDDEPGMSSGPQNFSWNADSRVFTVLLECDEVGIKYDWISRAHLSNGSVSDPGRKSSVSFPGNSLFALSFSGTSWLRRRNERDDDRAGSVRRLITSVGRTIDFFLCRAATSPI